MMCFDLSGCPIEIVGLDLVDTLYSHLSRVTCLFDTTLVERGARWYSDLLLGLHCNRKPTRFRKHCHRSSNRSVQVKVE